MRHPIVIVVKLIQLHPSTPNAFLFTLHSYIGPHQFIRTQLLFISYLARQMTRLNALTMFEAQLWQISSLYGFVQSEYG